MSNKRILAFGGSLRADSFNHKLAALASRGAVDAGAEVTLIRLSDYPMPLFNEDLESSEGMPESAAKLKKLFDEHDAFLIASPEYNSGYTAALKNAIDWVSRATEEDEPPLKVFADKTAAILAASPGGYGGSRGLDALRTLLGNIRVTVLEDQVAVAKVHEVMDDAGELTDEELQTKVIQLGGMLAKA